MKIFVSYARVDKPFCVRVIETLRAHDVWYDQRLYAGQDWWKEILRRLEWCEAFVYLLSPDSVASLYCRRELELALRLKRKIIPVLIDKQTVLPENMKSWHYVDLSGSLTVENVSQLLNAILVMERQRLSAPAKPAVSEYARAGPAPASNPARLISDGLSALEDGQYDRAVMLLRQAKASGYESRFVSLDKLLRIAETALSERSQTREVEREYQHIVALFAFESTRELACEALAEFRQEFGDYDPKNLSRHCAQLRPLPGISGIQADGNHRSSQPQAADAGNPAPPALVSSQAAPQSLAARAQAESPPARPVLTADARLSAKPALPMLEWRDIPHGTVTLSSVTGADEDFGEQTVQVESFVMSQYLVTNAQFAIFARAHDGYSNPRWWSFSPHAQRWFRLSKGMAQSRFAGDNLPRENVNWYEAMAFANWLGSLLAMKVSLPSLAQWQRAAKGDDDRYYPWGDDYSEEHCNTLETGLKTTTPVNRYRKGISPYGVYDMAGNVWEWTLKTASAAEKGRDQRRAVAGGSFVSPCDRAQTGFRYYLDPLARYSSIGIRLVGLS